MASIFHGLKPAAQTLGITLKEAPNRGFAEVTQEGNLTTTDIAPNNQSTGTQRSRNLPEEPKPTKNSVDQALRKTSPTRKVPASSWMRF